MKIFRDDFRKNIDSGEIKGSIHGNLDEYVSLTYGELCVYGSLHPIGGKTYTLKQRMNISQDTWVCHFYYTGTNGIYLGEDGAFTVEGMMTIIKSLSSVRLQ